MERLKVDDVALAQQGDIGFTFQYGEIKSSLESFCFCIEIQFTFQYGEIKSRRFKKPECKCAYLHSSMERLKENCSCRGIAGL